MDTFFTLSSAYMIQPSSTRQRVWRCDVPSVVERLYPYILGRCGFKEIEQLAYVNTRQECLDHLPNLVETSRGVQVNDVMQLFQGDGPEQQFENGEQRGENAGCCACSGDSRRYRDLTNSFHCPLLSLAFRNVELKDYQMKAAKKTCNPH